MKSNPIPVIGSGSLQWNAGGWFGASLGSSAWMLVTVCFLVAHNQPLVAAIAAIGFLANLCASLVLWMHRDRVDPFHALMAILGLMAFTIPMVWLFVQTYASTESKKAMNWPISPWSTILVIAIVPAVMIWFICRERWARSHIKP